MLTQVSKIQGSSISIPKDFIKNWKDSEILISFSDNVITLKKIENPIFWKTWENAQEIKDEISHTDCMKAIKSARKNS